MSDANDTTTAPYRDPRLSPEDRATDLIARMTVAEKVAQLGGLWVTALCPDGAFDETVARELMGDGIGQVTRIGASTGLRPNESAELMNQIQRIAVDGTRLGVPVVVHEESTGGYCGRDATVFPQAIGLASTWDPDLIEEVAGTIRQQMVAVGARQALAPVLDVARDPRWGRVEETYGEDPVLCGTMGAAYVRGIQGNFVDGVVATGKHFLAYGLSDGGRNHAPVHLGPRELREVYAEPFAAAIRDAGLASIMNSYSSIDGVPPAGSAEILDTLLRSELGFSGTVVADYFAVVLLRNHHRVAATKADAATQALAAGLDVELPALDCFKNLVGLVETGVVEVAPVDRAVRRVIEQKVRLGLFERPYVDATIAAASFDTAEQRALARRTAGRSIVLLENSGILPLAPRAESGSSLKLAVVGPAADNIRLLQGDYHYPAHTEIVYEGQGPGIEEDTLPAAGGAFAPGPWFNHHVTPAAGLRAAGLDVATALGCTVTADGDDGTGIAGAVALAEAADVAIVCVGGESGLQRHSTVGEFRDATNLDLTGRQRDLVEAVLATGTPTVVVIISGRVHALPWLAGRAGALVYAWVPGEEGGSALADVLTGTVDATGRLPVSLPRAAGQIPVHHAHRAGGSRSQFWGDYTDCAAAALYPFGHGLSYATFEWSGFKVSGADINDGFTATVTILNTGRRAGTEVVQLYVTDDTASIARPEQQLIGFTRIDLDASEAATVTFTVHPGRLAFFDAAMRFVAEPGSFTVRAGQSATAILCSATVRLDGEPFLTSQRDIVATSAAVRRGSVTA